MIFGVLLTLIGLFFSGFCFIDAVLHPWNYNGVRGLLGAFLGQGTLVPFILSLLVMLLGLGVCFQRAFGKQVE